MNDGSDGSDRSGDGGRRGGGDPSPMSRLEMEKAMADVTRLLQSRDFGSKEEMEAFIASQITGKRLEELKVEASERPIERAQELVYAADRADSLAERIRLAEAALEITRDCADAWVILAGTKARTPEEAKGYLEEGVAAGERALGPELFEEAEGHFWGLLETRPYMRARAELAHCLWYLGEAEASIAHYQDLLRLNPNDNQGLRDELVTRLLDAGHDEQVGELLERYEDDVSATWLYSRALWLFRLEGESETATAALAEAVEYNPHVPPYLLGDRRLPRREPDYIGLGDEREAQSYVFSALDVWKATPGARGWLLRAGLKRKGGRRRR